MLHVTFQCDGNHTRFRIGHVQACRLQFTPWILDPTKCSTVTCIRLPIGLCPAATTCGFSVPALVINALPAQTAARNTRGHGCTRGPFVSAQRAALAAGPARPRSDPLARAGSARGAWARDRLTARPLPGVPGLHFGGCGCVSGPALVLALPCSSHPLALAQRWSHSHRPARRVAQTQNGST